MNPLFSRLCLVLVAGCATLPDHPVERALYSDLRQIVDTRERVGWVIDSNEIDEATATALRSVCQIQEEKRLDLLDWFDDRIEQEGGSAEEIYLRDGNELDEAEEVLTLERMRALLERADDVAADECPFWLEVDPEFAGVQTDTHRFVLLAESIGGLATTIQAGSARIGASGGVRLLPAAGISDRFTLALGVEIGGAATFAEADDGSGQEVTARPTGAIPFVFRVHDETWLFDVELAALTSYHDDALALPPGARVLAGVGIGTVRIGPLMPYILAVTAYEVLPAFRDLPTSHTIRLGTRVGINYDP
jgi:hypothetical protein